MPTHYPSPVASWVLPLALALAASAAAPRRAPGQVRPGIEVLLTDSSHLIVGKRVGLLTNQAGVDRAGRRDVDLLRAQGVHLVALFSPEHGFQGAADRRIVSSDVDRATGLPIYSLYGDSEAPGREALDGLDLVLVDLQDIGARYYTYVGTAVLLLQHAARRDLGVLVLDRPDPLGGEVVQGNVRAHPAPPTGLIGFLPVAMRPGMTLGELLLLANDALHIGARVTVIPAAGWRRDMYFDATGLPWVRPSPAIPELESALHYPGTCLFEGTNLSVGRGTPSPFQVIGAPWLDPTALIRRLRATEGKGEARGAERDALAGVALSADTATPEAPGDGKYDGRRLNVIRLRVTDRRRYDPPRAAVAVLVALRALYPDSLVFADARFDQLAAGPELRRAVLAGASASAIAESWRPALARFRRARLKYLLY